MTARPTAGNAPIKPRPDELDHPMLGRIMRLASKANVLLYRSTGGLLGSTWRVGSAFPRGVPVLLLTTLGRKSGQLRTAPLLFIEDGADIIVVASQGGLPKNPQWYLNLQQHSEAQVQIKRRKLRVRGRTATPEERARLWPRLVEHYRDFASYAAWTGREIPVVVLSPTHTGPMIADPA